MIQNLRESTEQKAKKAGAEGPKLWMRSCTGSSKAGESRSATRTNDNRKSASKGCTWKKMENFYRQRRKATISVPGAMARDEPTNNIAVY